MQVCHGIFDCPGPDGNLYTNVEELRHDAKGITRQMYETRKCFFDRNLFAGILIVEFAAEECTPDDKCDEDQPTYGTQTQKSSTSRTAAS